MTVVERPDVLTALGFVTTKPTAAQQALLNLIHPLAESVFFAWFGSQGEYSQHIDLLPVGSLDTGFEEAERFELRGQQVQVSLGAPGSRRLQLPHTPVWATGLEVREDVGAYGGQASDSFSDATILTLGTDYWLDIENDATQMSSSGVLYRFGTWPAEPRSVMVTYYGGEKAARLASVAGNLKYACLLTIVKAYRTVSNLQHRDGPVISESIGKYSYSTSADVASALGGAGFTVPYEAQRAAWPARNLGRIFG